MNTSSFFFLLQNHFDQDLPWVAYRKPNTSFIRAFLQKDDELYTTTDFSESGFLFAPFGRAEESTVLIPEEHSEILVFEENQDSTPYVNTSQIQDKKNIDVDINDKNNHISLIQKGIKSIHAGVLRKVVLSRKQYIPYKGKSPFKIFKQLLSLYPTAFVYCFYHPKVGLWLGATPETLMSVHRQRLKTMSLAGTQRFRGTKDVQWGAKELEEQQLVTDSIVQNLGELVKELKVSDVQTHKAGSLLHLKTDIEALFEKGEIPLSKIITALHPTPAVCGLPLKEAKAFIEKNENYSRTYYTGFLGELNMSKGQQRSTNLSNIENLAYRTVTKHTDLFVNLRCMEIDAKGAQLYVGGGITGSSVPEAEWEETVDKLQTMARVL